MSKYLNSLKTIFEIKRGGQGNISCLEGLRGFAVLLVFLVHYIVLGVPALQNGSWSYYIVYPLHIIGKTGLDIFFLMSGYLIYGSLIRKEKPFAPFFARRIKRIYPAFIVMLGIYILLSFIFPLESKLPGTPLQVTIYILENMLLLPGIFPIPAIISVTWSLSYEVFYYLTIPWTISVLRLRSWKPQHRIYLFLLFSAIFLLLCGKFGGPVRMAMFGAGIVLYELLETRDIKKFPNGAGIIAWIAGITMIEFLPREQIGILVVQNNFWLAVRSGVLFIALFLLYLDCFSDQRHFSARIFSFTPLRYFGNISYSYFLIHGLTLKASFWLLGKIVPIESLGPLGFWLGIPVAFSVTVIAGLALYLLVERPLSIIPAQTQRASMAAIVELPPQ